MKKILFSTILTIICIAHTAYGMENATSNEASYFLAQNSSNNLNLQPGNRGNQNTYEHTSFTLCSCPPPVSAHHTAEIAAYATIGIFGAGSFLVSMLTKTDAGVVPSFFLSCIGITGLINYSFDECCIFRREQRTQINNLPSSGFEEV